MAVNTNEIHIDVNFARRSSFLGRSVEDGLPVTSPLENLEELLAWEPDDPEDAGQQFSIATIPYHAKNIPAGATKTLVCHDMAGGYLDDRFVQGTICKDDKWYYLENWDVIDTFIYFSHKFVTIPPVGWINCAHGNGVPVLGTIITESTDGYNRCKALFSNESIWKAVADQLVKLAQYYKFDGWLLNIENKLNARHVSVLNDFICYLRKQMHEAVPGSQIIWYDSVTKDGNLNWQNALNEENRQFFQACDGIFLNYGWSEIDLKNSADLASTLSRVQDVYVGVDVFGRGCFGGGGFNSCVALKMIRKYQLSAAIFAPGWVKEALGSKQFESNEKKFWGLLSPYCNSHNMSSSDQDICLMTTFSTGMSTVLEEGVRYLHLNRQETLPCLSGCSGLNSPLLPRNCGSRVSVGPNSKLVLFKTSKVVSKYSTLTFASHIESPKSAWHFILNTDIGPCELWYDGRTTGGIFVVELNRSFNNYVWTVRSESGCGSFVANDITFNSGAQPAVIYSLVLATKSVKNDKEVNLNDVIQVKIDDVTWEKPMYAKNSLLMSCTLIFENINETRPVIITYRCQNSESEGEFQFLGWAYCGRYRINKLPVSNPIFNGPGVKLIIKAQQDAILGGLDPGCIGELIVNYYENMKVLE